MLVRKGHHPCTLDTSIGASISASLSPSSQNIELGKLLSGSMQIKITKDVPAWMSKKKKKQKYKRLSRWKIKRGKSQIKTKERHPLRDISNRSTILAERVATRNTHAEMCAGCELCSFVNVKKLEKKHQVGRIIHYCGMPDFQRPRRPSLCWKLRCGAHQPCFSQSSACK